MQNRGRFYRGILSRPARTGLRKGTRLTTNVDIFEAKAKKVAEIDVLVLFVDPRRHRSGKIKAADTRIAERAMTARFETTSKKSVQDSYDQGLICAQKLTDPKFTLLAPTARRSTSPREGIYILCVSLIIIPSFTFRHVNCLRYERTDINPATPSSDSLPSMR